MILFQKDWGRYTKAIPDYKTTNKTALDMAWKYNQMGIKNCLFPLSLLQPELSGVDVYSPDLDTRLKVMISLEAEMNYWYYLREVSRVPPPAGNAVIQYRLDRANIATAWCFHNHVDVIQIQMRQTGKSVGLDVLQTWLYLLRCINSLIVLMTKDDTLRVSNIQRLQRMRYLLPDWMVVDDKNDANNTIRLTYRTRGNTINTVVSQNSEEAADKQARGNTSPNRFIDEAAYISYLDVIMSASGPATNEARRIAELNSQPYGNVFTTTAGRLDNRSGKYFHKFMTESTIFTEKLYDCADKDHLYKTIKENSPSPDKIKPIRTLNVWSHNQLGISDQRLGQMMVEANSYGEAADKDYFNRWLSGGLGNPIPPSVLEVISKSQMSPLYSEITPTGHIVRWYIEENDIGEIMRNEVILIGVDTSDAIGQDAVSVTFTRETTLEVLAAANYNSDSLITLADNVAGLLVKYPKAVMVIEKKSSAQTFIDTAIPRLLAAGMDPFKKIFNRFISADKFNAEALREFNRKPLSVRTMEDYKPFRSLFGWNTTGASRPTLMSKVLLHATSKLGALTRDATLIHQILGLENKNDRVEHKAGGHDDMVISWLLPHYVLMYETNLEYYGIDTRRIKIRVDANGQALSAEELLRQEQQRKLSESIDQTTEALRTTKDPYLIPRLEQRLAVLVSKLDPAWKVKYSITDIIRDASKSRADRLSTIRRGSHVQSRDPYRN